MVELLRECVPTFGNQLRVIPLDEPTTVGCEEEKAEGKKRDVPNYLERKPSYFDEEKGEWLTRNKTRNATMVRTES